MKKLKDVLDVTTNVVVVVFAVVAIGVLAKNHFAPKGAPPRAAVQKGSAFPQIAGADYRQSPRTLILALNVDCRYCTKSLPFYHRLAEAQREHSGQFNVVGAFLNKDGELVKSYAEEKRLAVPTLAGVDFAKLGIDTTPTLVLVDGKGTVLNSWRGALQDDGEREVFDALGVPFKPEVRSSPAAVSVKKTADIFDEQKAVLSIRPQDGPQNDPNHFVEVFDVNRSGDAYLVVASFCIFTPGGSRTLPNVRAEGGGCNTSDVCFRNTTNNSCYCSLIVIGGQGCTGCFTKNNDTGCGNCSNGGGGGELD